MTQTPVPSPPPEVLMHRLRNYLLTGIVVSAPIILTVYLTVVTVDFIDAKMRGLLPDLLPEQSLPGVGLVIAVLAFFGFFGTIGWLATNILGRMFIRLSEMIFARMPVVRTLYSALKQMFEMVMGNQARAFREAVLVEFPVEGSWAIGFVTGVTTGEVQNKTVAEVVNVFVPTTPNPTSGYLLFVPEEKMIRLKMPVEDALKMVISGGIITPPDRSRAVVAVEVEVEEK